MKEFNYDECFNRAKGLDYGNWEEIEYNEDEMNLDVMSHYDDRVWGDDAYEVADERKSLYEALAKLTPEQRVLLQMRNGFKDNKYYSWVDMGKHLGWSETKVKSQEAKALYTLRGLMDPQERQRRIDEGYKDLLRKILA